MDASVTLRSAVALAMSVAPPVEVEFIVLIPLKAPIDVFATIAPPEIKVATSTPVTEAPVGATSTWAIAAVLTILIVSTPKPPFSVSAIVNVEAGVAPTQAAMNVSSALVPVRASTEFVNTYVVPAPPDDADTRAATAVVAAAFPDVTVEATAVTPSNTALAAATAAEPEYVLPSLVTAVVYVFATLTLLAAAVTSLPCAPDRI